MLGEKIKVAIGIVAGVLGLGALAFGLGQLVISENANDCKKIGLKGDLVSCSVDNDYVYDRIALVVGNTANSPAPKISDETEKYIINSMFKHKDDNGFKLDIYSATPSRPKISYRSKIQIEENDNLAAIVEKYSQVKNELDEAIASGPVEDNVDYYNAISTVGKKLSSNSEGKKSLLIIIGSGLSDTGVLSFRDNGIPEKPNDAINSIIASREINEDALENVNVVWSFIGQTAHPQTRLSPSEESSIRTTYENLVDRMGSKEISFDDDINDNDSVETTYSVAIIPTKDASLNWGDKDFVGDHTEFSFKADSAELVDAKSARNKLDELARELNADSRKTVTIKSYHAKKCGESNATPNDELLNSRSNAIKAILEEKGISSNRIIVLEGGFGGSEKCSDPNDRRVTISVKKGGNNE